MTKLESLQFRLECFKAATHHDNTHYQRHLSNTLITAEAIYNFCMSDTESEETPDEDFEELTDEQVEVLKDIIANGWQREETPEVATHQDFS